MEKCPNCGFYSVYFDRKRKIKICTNPKCDYTTGKKLGFGIDPDYLKRSIEVSEKHIKL